MNLKTFNILTAYVNYKIDIGAEFLRCGVMRDSLDHTEIGMKGVFDYILAVPGHSRTDYFYVGKITVKLLKIFLYDRHRIAAVRRVERAEKVPVRIAKHSLHGSRPRIYAEIHFFCRCVAEDYIFRIGFVP